MAAVFHDGMARIAGNARLCGSRPPPRRRPCSWGRSGCGLHRAHEAVPRPLSMKRLWCDISEHGRPHARKAAAVWGSSGCRRGSIGMLAVADEAATVRCVFAAKPGRAACGPVCGRATFSTKSILPRGRFWPPSACGRANAVYAHELQRSLQTDGAGVGRRLLRRLAVGWSAQDGAHETLAALGPTATRPGTGAARRRGHGPAAGSDDVLLLLGSTWAQPAMMRFARRPSAPGLHGRDVHPRRAAGDTPEFSTTGHARRFGGFSLRARVSPRDMSVRLMPRGPTSRRSSPRRVAPCRVDVVPLAHEFFGYPRGDRRGGCRRP